MRLKSVARAGWLRVGVERPESVAAHSWGVAWLVLALCPAGVDRGRALAIAVLHDLAEVVVGDITPHDGVDPAVKSAAEGQALAGMVSPFVHANELSALWREYVCGATAEGRFVKACDKLDMALMAAIYAQDPGVETGEFVDSALARLSDPDLRALACPDGGIEHEET